MPSPEDQAPMKKQNTRSAMILAAGRGERMRPLTDVLPKPLLTVNGVTLIDRHLQCLGQAGINNVVINTSWLGDTIQQHIGDGQQWDINVRYSEEPTALETAGGILQALPLLAAHGDREFLVINADVFCDNPVPQLLAMQLGSDLGRLLLTTTPDYLNGDFRLDGDRILHPTDAQSPYTYCGLARYTVDMFAGLSAGRHAMLPLLRTAIDAGALGGQTFSGRWLDVGTPERLEQASRIT